MSMLLMVKAMQIRVGNPARKLVLLKLADNANDQGVCWPSYQNIADHCEVSKRSVMNHIKSLEADGLVRREYRKGKNGNSSNVYHLTLEGSENAAPPSENVSPPSENVSPPSENISPRTSHSFEPVNESVNDPKRSMSSNLDAIQVLEHLNVICSTKYKPSTKSHIQNINARLSEGHTVEDCKAVIEHKFREWGSDTRFAQYLRPQTLFQTGKFQGYLASARAKPKPSEQASTMIDISNMNYTSGSF